MMSTDDGIRESRALELAICNSQSIVSTRKSLGCQQDTRTQNTNQLNMPSLSVRPKVHPQSRALQLIDMLHMYRDKRSARKYDATTKRLLGRNLPYFPL